MTPLDQAHTLLGKAAQDEALLDSIVEDKTVSTEIFGYHCQQAGEAELVSARAHRGPMLGEKGGCRAPGRTFHTWAGAPLAPRL